MSPRPRRSTPPHHPADPAPASPWRGLGPVSVGWLHEVGIQGAEDLQSHDVFELYRELKQRHTAISRNLLYALIGAQENRDWREVARTDKTSILLRLEAMGLL